MIFRYRAYNEGAIVSGTVDAVNQQEAISYLRRKGYLTVEIGPANMAVFTYFLNLINRPTKNDILHFTRQLSIMMNSGLTVIESIDILRRQTTKPSLLRMIGDIDTRLKAGEPFSAALQEFPHLFSNLYISLIKAGEASGKLNIVLSRLAENMEKQREFTTKLRNALIYPVIIVIGMIAVVFIMVTFVMPELLNLYADLDITLPVSTQILIAISNLSSRFWPLILVSVAASAVALRTFLQTANGKRILDNLLLQLPLVGNLIRMASLINATRTLSVLISSGVSILEALQIIVDTTNNTQYQQSFEHIYDEVEKGVTLADAMTKESIFPPILIQMTTVGEQTGKLDETLQRISAYFEFESEYAIKALTALIEPVIIVILGIGVGLLVVSVITPIYNLTSNF